ALETCDQTVHRAIALVPRFERLLSGTAGARAPNAAPPQTRKLKHSIIFNRPKRYLQKQTARLAALTAGEGARGPSKRSLGQSKMTRHPQRREIYQLTC
ncbi:MAG: hypothetical protein M3Y84_01260, partial [Acidobacteriota bacterium]|nr:hypothetical protein [Acidobacteriota bacterium]